MRQAFAGAPNVRVAEASYGDGVYEAVVTELASCLAEFRGLDSSRLNHWPATSEWQVRPSESSYELGRWGASA